MKQGDCRWCIVPQGGRLNLSLSNIGLRRASGRRALMSTEDEEGERFGWSVSAFVRRQGRKSSYGVRKVVRLLLFLVRFLGLLILEGLWVVGDSVVRGVFPLVRR